MTKNAENAKRIAQLELMSADANARAMKAESDLMPLKRMHESSARQLQELEKQIKANSAKEKTQDERIAALAKQLADERVALSDS